MMRNQTFSRGDQKSSIARRTTSQDRIALGACVCLIALAGLGEVFAAAATLIYQTPTVLESWLATLQLQEGDVMNRSTMDNTAGTTETTRAALQAALVHQA